MNQSSWRACSCCRTAQICPPQPAVRSPCTPKSKLSWQGREHRTQVLPAARMAPQSSAACWRLSHTWRLTRPALRHLAICTLMQVSIRELLFLPLVLARVTVLHACRVAFTIAWRSQPPQKRPLPLHSVQILCMTRAAMLQADSLWPT